MKRRSLPLPSAGALLLLFLLASPPLPADEIAHPSDSSDGWGQDEGEWGEDEGGGDFDEGVESALPALPTAATPSAWSAKGFVRSDQALWAERPKDPFAKSRQSFDLQIDYKKEIWRARLSTHLEHDLAYSLYRDNYDVFTLQAYESLFQLRETWLAASLGEFELTVGRQIVAWGEGDGLSPLDVVNPRDMREPGLADLDDLRIPVLASRIGWFHGNHRVEAMIVHEADFGLRDSPQGPFSPLTWLIDHDLAASPQVQALKSAGIDIADRFAAIPFGYHHQQDRFDAHLQQGFLRWVYKGPGIDLGLYAASVLDQQGVILLSDKQQADMMAAVIKGSTAPMTLDLDHRRYELAGTSGAYSYGSWLAKWELSFEHRHPYNAGVFPKLTVARSDVIGAMLGISYTGIADTTLAIEASKMTLLDKPVGLLFPVDQPVVMFRAIHRAMRDDLMLIAVASVMGVRAEYGWLARAEVSYKLIQALKLSVGYITYQPTEKFGPFSGLTEHDRVFARLRWDFEPK